MKKEYGHPKISDNGNLAYLPGIQAAVIVSDTSKVLFPVDNRPTEVLIKGKKDMPKVVPWGESNNFPKMLTDKIAKVPVMSANLFFNISSSFGSGIEPVVEIPVGKDKEIIPLFNAELYLAELIGSASEYTKPIYENILNEVKSTKAELDKFWEDNDIDLYLLESLTDIHWFFNNFPEIILSKDGGKNWKIVQIQSKEAVFSRLSEMNKNTGKIEYHYYYGDWGGKAPDNEENIAVATPMLDFYSPVRDLRQRMQDDMKKARADKTFSYICPINLPTPGRSYYQKPYWYSLIESGWYDFAVSIPKLKSSMIENQAIVKYIIELDQRYFEDIFVREKITGDKEKNIRIQKEYDMLNKFLVDRENNGKSIVTTGKVDLQGNRFANLKISAVENSTSGGEYLADSEEVSNIMCYAMLVHPSLVGASPGKNKNISGTEARELFLIKQAILKPIIKRILKPFYLIRDINGWSKYLHFTIPNIQLTTLDEEKTGVKTVIENAMKTGEQTEKQTDEQTDE